MNIQLAKTSKFKDPELAGVVNYLIDNIERFESMKQARNVHMTFYFLAKTAKHKKDGDLIYEIMDPVKSVRSGNGKIRNDVFKKSEKIEKDCDDCDDKSIHNTQKKKSTSKLRILEGNKSEPDEVKVEEVEKDSGEIGDPQSWEDIFNYFDTQIKGSKSDKVDALRTFADTIDLVVPKSIKTLETASKKLFKLMTNE